MIRLALRCAGIDNTALLRCLLAGLQSGNLRTERPSTDDLACGNLSQSAVASENNTEYTTDNVDVLL